MANRLYQQMVNEQTKSLPNNQLMQVRQLANMMKSNPQQMLEQMIANNPQASSMMTLIQSSGQSPKQLFFNLAKQKGIDPNQIIQMLR